MLFTLYKSDCNQVSDRNQVCGNEINQFCLPYLYIYILK